MFRDVIPATMTLEQWLLHRQEIRRRVLATLGQEPSVPGWKTCAKVHDRRDYEGLGREEIRFEILPGIECAGTFLVPPGRIAEHSRPGVLCIHGTTMNGRLWEFATESGSKSPYGLELARRGFVVLAVDQYGFGDWCPEGMNEARRELERSFYKQFPDWSLDGIRQRIHACAIDLLADHPLVDPARLACIGNSLGGRGCVYLGALDERVAMTVTSTGISPNLTNVYRNLPGGCIAGANSMAVELSPALNRSVFETGRPSWEYNELLALIAPRGLLALEPFNDPYNSYVEATVSCILKARRAWELYGKESYVEMLCHGTGHGTPLEMREYAYRRMEIVLGASSAKRGDR
jgi:pimeloyl-ACP methyl ester carboxylesterase